MAEILVKAVSVTNEDPALSLEEQAEKTRRGCYQKGYPVVVMPDGHQWGAQEGPPTFVIIYIPLISVAKVLKYVDVQMDDIDPSKTYRRRKWQIRWDDLPQEAQDKLENDGELTIKAIGTYQGEYDYTWVQVKQYFRNLETDTDETEDLD